MRRISGFLSFLIVAGVLVIGPSDVAAQERAAIEGFGGLSLNNALQSTSLAPSLGGTVTYSVVPNIQLVGEAGRLSNVLPTLSGTVFSVTGTGVSASAFYGEGGARLLLAPDSAFTPYAEATAGIARLDIRSDRLSPVANAATSIALGYVGRTTPTLGAGGGFVVQGGPILFDVGYRYKQLFANDVMRFALGFGQQLHTHQVRVGLGVRF
jgi:opacity protein-like surface antigen